MIKRLFMSLIGVLVCAISVGIFKLAAFGVDPFQTTMSGLDQLFPISFGLLYVIVNLVLLIFSLIAEKHNIGMATFINLFLLGYITQYTFEFLQKTWEQPSMMLRITSIIVAIVLICFGSSLYMTADLGISTYDAIAIVMSKKWRLAKFQYCRIITDLVCIVIGVTTFLLGKGKISDVSLFLGIGTIITAFFMGPLIEFFNKKISRPMLEKKRPLT